MDEKERREEGGGIKDHQPVSKEIRVDRANRI